LSSSATYQTSYSVAPAASSLGHACARDVFVVPAALLFQVEVHVDRSATDRRLNDTWYSDEER
jgi:hypothetical protein